MAGVTLGGITFRDFEIPNQINFGGKHQLAVHKMPGGTRVIDAMGADADQISWSGRFRGSDAISRAQALDEMRMSGGQYGLSWLSLYRNVIIVDFKANTEKAFEVPYQITCEVVNETAASLGITQSIDALVGNDLAAALGFAGVPTNALSKLDASLDAIGALNGANAATRTAAAQATNDAMVSLQDTSAALDSTLGATMPPGDPDNMAGWMVTQLAAAQAQSATMDALGYVTRMNTNVLQVKS